MNCPLLSKVFLNSVTVIEHPPLLWINKSLCNIFRYFHNCRTSPFMNCLMFQRSLISDDSEFSSFNLISKESFSFEIRLNDATDSLIVHQRICCSYKMLSRYKISETEYVLWRHFTRKIHMKRKVLQHEWKISSF